MSGFVAIARLDGTPVDVDAVERAVSVITHRGPDGRRSLVDGSVALAHLQHRTTPWPTGFPLQDGRVLVTGAARIDNRAALRDRLGPFDDPVSDAALVLAAYRQWGRACPVHLVGAYAVAIVDRAADRVFLARDHAGLRPAFLARTADRVAVASDIEPLLALEWVTTAVDDGVVVEGLVGAASSAARTIYADVDRLPAGTSATVTTDGIERRRHWRPEAIDPLDLPSDRAYEVGFRELFDRAVADRCRGPAVGSLLSGGLDSSAVTCAAAGHRSQIPTYSLGFDATPVSDEREYARAVVDHVGARSTVVDGDAPGPFADAEAMLSAVGRPIRGNTTYLHWRLYRAAAADVDVVLGGFGGDAVVSHGLGRLTDLARRGHWLGLARELRARAHHRGESPWRRLYTDAVRPLVPRSARRLARRLRDGDPIERLSPVIDRDRARAVAWPDRLRQAQVTPSPLATHRERQVAGLARPNWQFDLEAANALGAAAGVEPRFPFFDRRLMAFCIGMPADQSLRDGVSRSILRRAVELPERVRDRHHKSSLAPAYRRALVDEREQIRQLYDTTPDALWRYLDRDACLGALDRAAEGPFPALTARVYRPGMLAAWSHHRPDAPKH
ncbi:asparagine synthetase B family protein [Halococcoides cellulosivorans]|uniref:asparagine synthetase B family protein n=1 Tax=Halococcoides cellulosivorans TaxID=1679096 RepID=UPI00131EF4C1|nr:asparagine synthetase B [Halococcoides cellulosivorans]